MCRMMAIRGGDDDEVRNALLAFRTQASAGRTGPQDHRVHPDGWGIVALTPNGLTYVGRSPKDASKDTAYLQAVERAAVRLPGTWVLAHVRNASVGRNQIANTHPFIADGWAFAHNGTIRDLEPVRGRRVEGTTDSERYFHHVLKARGPNGSFAAAVRSTTDDLAKDHEFSSLTCLATDGRSLVAHRRVGPGESGCGTRECALEHYALGVGRYGSATVLLQEPALLPTLRDWTPIEDGGTLHMPASLTPTPTP